MSEETLSPAATIGHNAPPDPLIVEANERIDTANRYLIERGNIDEWDATIADKANAFLEQVTGTHGLLNKQRLQEGHDFKAIQDAKYKEPLSLLETAAEKLRKLKRAYLKKEEDRLEAERKAKEAELRAAQEKAAEAQRHAEEEARKKGGDPLRAEMAALKAQVAADEIEIELEQPAPKATIGGTYSSRNTGLKDYWSGRITDINEAFKFFNKAKNPYKQELAAAVLEALTVIAGKEARLHKDKTKAPPGVEFVVERK